MTRTDVFRIHLNPNKTLPLALGNMTAMVARHRPHLLDVLNLDTPILTDRLHVEQMVRSGGFSKTAIFLMSDYVWYIQAHTALSQAFLQPKE